MPVPVFSSATAGDTGDGVPLNSITFSHTCSGSDRLLLVSITVDWEGGNQPSVSSITFNGDALTFVGGITLDGSAGRTELWGLVNPDAAAGNVVVTLSGGLSQEMAVTASSFTSAHQTTQPLTPATAQGTGTAPSGVVSSAAGDLVYAHAGVQGDPPTTSGAGQTNRAQEIANNATPVAVAAVRVDTEPGAASVTMSWSGIPASQEWGVIGVSINGVDDPPANVNPAVIAGTAQRGATLTLTDGDGAEDWTGETSIARQWQRADNSGFSTNLTDIGGATAATFLLTASEVAKHVRCRVRATNAVGSTDSFSGGSGAVADPAAPVNTGSPDAAVLGGSDLEVGATVTCTQGTWSNSPLAYAYQWQRSPDGTTDWTDIGGAISATYVVLPADVDKFLRCKVSATNANG